MTESFPSDRAHRKAEREVEEYRNWQQSSREFVEVNTAICRLGSASTEEATGIPQEKEGKRQSGASTTARGRRK